MAEINAANAGTITLGGELAVNRLGLGTNRIADNDASRAVLRRAVALGVQFIDTAEMYRQSEAVIGATLAPYPPGVVVSTKGGVTQQFQAANDPANIRRGVEQSLRLLRLDHLPCYFLHRLDPTRADEAVGALRDLRDEGLIHHVALSDVTIAQIERARRIVPIAAVQNEYNLLERKHDAVVDYCAVNGLAFLPWFPLSRGRYAAAEATLDAIGARLGATRQQLALAWLLRRSPAMLPIPGTTSVAHLESNLAAATLPLDDDVYAAIDALAG
jgi:aryl-alcohol dehydrogenase-like predicted oxidoreductase